MAILKLGTPSGVILKDNSSLTTSTVTTEQTIISYPILANTLNLSNEVEMMFYCRLFSAALLPGSLTIRMKFGGATLTIGNQALTLVSSLAGMPLFIRGLITCKDSLTNQYMYGEMRQSQVGLSVGSLTGAPNIQSDMDTEIDVTQEQIFTLTAQFSSANANNRLVLKHARAVLS